MCTHRGCRWIPKRRKRSMSIDVVRLCVDFNACDAGTRTGCTLYSQRDETKLLISLSLAGNDLTDVRSRKKWGLSSMCRRPCRRGKITRRQCQHLTMKFGSLFLPCASLFLWALWCDMQVTNKKKKKKMRLKDRLPCISLAKAGENCRVSIKVPLVVTRAQAITR